MKVKLEELEKAIKWMATNTHEINVTVVEMNGNLEIRTFDKSNREIVISLSREGSLFPTIRRTETL